MGIYDRDYWKQHSKTSLGSSKHKNPAHNTDESRSTKTNPYADEIIIELNPKKAKISSVLGSIVAWIIIGCIILAYITPRLTTILESGNSNKENYAPHTITENNNQSVSAGKLPRGTDGKR